MKKCERCGKEFNDGDFFCPFCGSELVAVSEVKETKEKQCPKCGTRIPARFVFCPECGASIDDEETIYEDPKKNAAGYTAPVAPAPAAAAPVAPAPAAAAPVAPAPAVAAPVAGPVKKKMEKKKKIIIGCCIIALLIAALIIGHIISPRDLTLNSGESIEMYVGDEQTVTLSGEGLSDADYLTARWTTDNGDVLTVDNGTIRASYDSLSFNELYEEGEEEDMDPCSCSTYVKATIKKGLKTWEGSLPVNISLKPVKIESGTMIKEPADERTSSLTVTPSSEYNTYIYLESKTKKANDMSFIVKKGEETTVSVPLDKYIMYWANGDTWYGGDYLFGPQTTYQKDPEEWDFSNYTWTFKLETTDGNLSGETVEEDEFPEL